MKIEAKDLKVGMTVKYGNVWVLIQSIRQTTFKNGKEKTEVVGKMLEGVIRRSNGFRQKIEAEDNFSVDFKSTTTVSIK